MEIWKNIENYENKYQISNFGNVKSLNYRGTKKEKLLKLVPNKIGYINVQLSKNGIVKPFYVHRLVAIAFIENPKNKPYINHLDCNINNNNVENLEWCTHSENEKHSFDKLGKITNGIIRRKIPLNKIVYIKELYKKGFSQRSIAKQFNVSPTTIGLIINQKTYIKHV